MPTQFSTLMPLLELTTILKGTKVDSIPTRAYNAFIDLASGIDDIIALESKKLPLLSLSPYIYVFNSLNASVPNSPDLAFDRFAEEVFTILSRAGTQIDGQRKTAILVPIHACYKELFRDENPAKEGMSVAQWLASDDTGSSSKFMVSVLSGEYEASYAHPYDLDDFTRCVIAFKSIPSIEGKLSLMSAQSLQWEALVRRWDYIDLLMTVNPQQARHILDRCIKQKAEGKTQHV